MTWTESEADAQMDEWRRAFERRDLIVRESRAAGRNVRQIALHMGLSRDTVYKILGEVPSGKK